MVLCAPAIASAHEVYVLDAATVARDIAATSPNPFLIIPDHRFQFLFWGSIAVVTTLTVFGLSIGNRLERLCHPLLAHLKQYAPIAARLTLGICLIASGYMRAWFGPELPFSDFGTLAPLLGPAFIAAGVLIAFGVFTRIAAIAALAGFAYAAAHYGSYMLTYVNYLGEMLAVLALGSGRWSVDRALGFDRAMPARLRRALHRLEPYAFSLARVGFGVAIIFASVFAKFIHSDLALDTITQYRLTDFFPFDPLFIVLGACIIEFLIGAFFIIGIEIRWTALFFLFWICLSLLYFGEAVWPHLMLIGLNITFVLHGYDRYSLEGRFFKKRALEPVL